MDESTIEDVRKQFRAPDLSGVSPDVRAYIEKLERNTLDLARIRLELYEGLGRCQDQLALMKMRGTL